MEVQFQELNPRDALLEIDGHVYEFEAFTLKAKVWAYYEFKNEDEADGLKVLAELFKKTDLIAVSKVLYFLLKDKTEFATEEKFTKRFSNIRDSHSRLYGLINTIFGISEVEITDEDRENAAILGKVEAAKD